MYLSPNIIRVIRRLRWAGDVVRLGESGGAYRIPAGRPERRRPLARSRHRWMDNIKMDLREVVWGTVWIAVAQDVNRWRAGCCECGNEPSGFVKCREFLD